MARPQHPMRRVVKSRLGPRSQRFTFPDGSVAIVCGPPARHDTLVCGHHVVTWGPAARARRCEQCQAEGQGTLL